MNEVESVKIYNCIYLLRYGTTNYNIYYKRFDLNDDFSISTVIFTESFTRMSISVCNLNPGAYIIIS